MAKRKGSVSLSFVLLRFAVVMFGCMLLCCLVWLAGAGWMQSTGIVYQGSAANRQVEEMLAGEPAGFVSPGDDFLAEYGLFDRDGKVLESNVGEKTLETLSDYFQKESDDIHIMRYTYEDGSTIVMRWFYRKEFVDPKLRRMLPPFEYLWWGTLGLACVLCLLLNTLWLRRQLAARLKLFGEVSRKVGAQELDFIIPHAGIREYDEALDAMEQMREALYSSLSSQWAAQQEREAEIAALAHDLKTPLTLVGGNAELLLEEELPDGSRKMVEIIAAASSRARQYVASLLEASAGENEVFADTSLPVLFEELCRITSPLAAAGGICLQTQNDLKGGVVIQRNHMLRALGNIVQNAVEHMPPGGTVYVEGSMRAEGWRITVRDEGPGFSEAALHHAAERLWRGDTARGGDGHNGLGLWFAAQTVKNHGGQLELQNYGSGGIVTVTFRFVSGREQDT